MDIKFTEIPVIAKCCYLSLSSVLFRCDSHQVVKNEYRDRFYFCPPQGRPKRRSMAVEKEDMKLVGVREEDGEDKVRWRWIISHSF